MINFCAEMHDMAPSFAASSITPIKPLPLPLRPLRVSDTSRRHFCGDLSKFQKAGAFRQSASTISTSRC